MDKIPAMAAPPGWVNDFNSPVNRATLYIGVSSFVVPLAFIFVCLKLYMKFFVLRKPGLEDVASVLALTGLSSYMGVYIWLLNQGAGRHAWDVNLALYLDLVKYSRILAIIQQPTSLFAKLALLGMYHRLFSPKKEIKYTIWVGMFICVAVYATIFGLWISVQDTVAGFNLVNQLDKAQGILNLCTDVYIFVVPLFAVSTLTMSTSKKIGLAAVFMTGSLAVASCVISVVYRFQVMTATGDLSWQLVPFYVVLTTEIAVGIIVGCMPVLPALLQKAGVKKWWSSTFRSLTSRFRGSHSGTNMSSTKKPSAYVYDSNNSKGEEYHQLKESRSIQKQTQIDVVSTRENSLHNHSDYV